MAGKIGSTLWDAANPDAARALQDLAAHAAQLASDHSPIALWVAALDYSLLYFNQPFSVFTGRPRESDLGLGWTSLLHPDDLPTVLPTFSAVAARGERYVDEYRLRREDGRYRWVRAIGSPFFEPAETLRGYIGASLDITDLMEARSTEARTRERLELAIAGTQVGTFDWPDMTESYFWVSPEAYRIGGYEPGEVPSTVDTLFDLMHPDDRDTIRELIARAAATHEPYDVQYRLRDKSGTYRWYRIRAIISLNERGNPRMTGTSQDIDEQVRAAAEIARLQEHVERAMQASTSILWDWDIGAGRMWYSASMKSALGYTPDEEFAPTDIVFRDSMHPDDWPMVKKQLLATFRRRTPFESMHRLRRKSGEYRWYHTQGVAQWNDAGRAVRVAGSMSDIHERKLAEDALAAERSKALVTLSSINDAVISTDPAGFIEFMNPAAERLIDGTAAAMRGRLFTDVIRLFEQGAATPIVDPIHECLTRGQPVTGRDLRLTSAAGDLVIEFTLTALMEPPGRPVGTVAVLRNVTEERRLASAMSYQATHDALTGLVNRLEFERRLQRILQNAQSTRTEHAMCYLDLDQFKVINDTCGHSAGDELLRQIGVTLRDAVRKRDTVARLGGDEFAVLMEHCTLQQARRVAGEVREKIAEYRFRWNEKVFGLGVSIGLVQVTDASGSVASVLKNADAACYVAKEQGRNRVHVYDPGDITLERRRGEMEWVSKITAALQSERFTLYAQPARRLHGSGPAYVEILLRYPTELGVSGPTDFLPAAERYNLSHKVDRFVVRRLLRWYAENRQRIHPDTLFAVNLSGMSLADESLLGDIHEQFNLYKVPPQRICFEITETAAIGNMSRALQFFQSLKVRGCRFALDDFGSGLSSFGYLRSLPVDFLKIDGMFVRDCVRDPIDLAMVKSINEIGHVMGVQTIAEFVEDDAIAAQITALGVDYAQGFGIDRPMGLEAFLARQPKVHR